MLLTNSISSPDSGEVPKAEGLEVSLKHLVWGSS